MADTNAPPPPNPDSASRWTFVAFVLLVALVCGRAMLTEILRDPFLPTPTLRMEGMPPPESPPRAPGPATSLALDLLLCVPALLVLTRRTRDPQYTLRFSWSFVPMGLLAAWSLASVGWASDRFAALVESADWASAMVVVWTACQLVRSWARLHVVAAAATGLLLAYVAAGINYRLVEWPQQVRSWNDPDDPNGRAAYLRQHALKETDFAFVQFEKKVLGGEMVLFGASPNTYAAALVLMGLAAAGLTAQRWANRDAAGWVVLGAIAVGGAAVGLYWARSRTAGATFVLGLLLIAASGAARRWTLRWPRGVYWAGLGAFIAGCGTVVAWALSHGSLFEKSLTFRWYYWVGAARMARQHWVRGVGFGGFGDWYLQFRLPQAPEEVKDPHNFLVRFAAELGVVGAVLVTAWMARLWWELTRPRGPVGSTTAAATSARTRGIVPLIWIAALACGLAMACGCAWEKGGAYMALQVMGFVGMTLLLLVGMAAGALDSLREERIDDRPSPWVLRGLVVGLGMFLLHNLVDFAMFETAPMCVFALVAGAALGARQPAAGPRLQTRAAGAGLAAMGLAWAGAAGLVWLPTALAEQSAAAGDALVLGAGIPNPAERIAMLSGARNTYDAATHAQPWNGEYAFRAAHAMAYQPDSPWASVSAKLQSAITANPRRVRYRVFAAQFAVSRGQWTSAVEGYKAALTLVPADVQTRLDLAATMASAGDRAGAAAQYREALRYDNQLPADEPKRLSKSARDEVEARAAQLER